MAIGDTLLDRHKLVFAVVAKEPPIGLGVWILVRGTNKDSLDHLPKDDYKIHCTPKPIDCKAKTAAMALVLGSWSILTALRTLLLMRTLRRRLSSFGTTGTERRVTRCSTVNERSATQRKTSRPLKGCIKLDGKYIHGDYDLKTIIVPGHESATIALVTDLQGVTNVRHGPKFYEVQRRVNAAIGADMVQHGAEDKYTGHSGDSIFVFGPKGEYEELRGLAQIQSWYAKWGPFGRRTLDADFSGGIPAGFKAGIRGVVQPDGSVPFSPANCNSQSGPLRSLGFRCEVSVGCRPFVHSTENWEADVVKAKAISGDRTIEWTVTSCSTDGVQSRTTSQERSGRAAEPARSRSGVWAR